MTSRNKGSADGVYFGVRTICALAAALSVLLLLGCGTTPNLDLVWKNEMTVDDMIRDAPVIVIGQVIEQRAVGPIRDSCRLVRVVSTVENVVRGQGGADRITFYFYSAWLGASGDVNWLQQNGRYVLFLMWDHGVLRAVRDHWRTSIRVYSGMHPALPLTPEEPLPERIATLLFMPGADLDPDEFSAGLLHAVGYGVNYLGRWRTAQLLIALLENGHQAVRIGACEELTLSFNGIGGCWDTVHFGDGSLFRSRHGVISPRISRKRRRHWIAETRDAGAWWRMAVKRFSVDELMGEVRLLTVVDDPEIRKRFRGLLEEKYPHEKSRAGGQRLDTNP